jgi:type IV pilus assembly protein PilE
MRHPRGFTLLELMIVVVVIGILAVIAYPSYTSHLVKSNRAAAQSFMLDLANREEQYLLDMRAYGTLAQLGMSVPAEVSPYYTVSIAVDNTATPPTYTISAAPISGTMQENDGTLSLDSTGAKSPSDKWN